MPFPFFFDAVPRITVYDPLAALLGAGDGLIEYGYADVVRLAGHSCPTVAGTYLMTLTALRALYPGVTPHRGGVRVDLRDAEHDGVTGVMAAVAQLITGAAGAGGFKGLAGRHERAGLLGFGLGGAADMVVTRLDSGDAVEVWMDTGAVPADPRMGPLLRSILAGAATAEATAEFGALWQGRVRRILLDHADEVVGYRVAPSSRSSRSGSSSNTADSPS